MPARTASLIQRWSFGLRAAWFPIILFVVLSFLLGSQLTSPQRVLTPPFAFTSSTTTIEASGSWHTSGTSIPNATNIFCWFPVNTCQVTVAQLVPDGARSRFQLTEKSLDIVELSDTSLTATSTSTDPCRIQTLHIDRKGQGATLTVGPSKTASCPGIMTKTATLGG